MHMTMCCLDNKRRQQRS